MADSLQDQLRALGLSSSQAEKKKGRRHHSRQTKRRAGRGESKPGEEMSLDEMYALREREEQCEAERARKQKQEEVRRRRERNRAIREIVAAGRQNSEEAEIPRNFMFNGRIRKLYVTASQRRALDAGELGIVYLSGSYHLLQSGPLEAVRRISDEHVVDLRPDAGDEESEHPVPDDLIW